MARAFHIAGVTVLLVAGLVACADDGSRRTTSGGGSPTSATSSPSRTPSSGSSTPTPGATGTTTIESPTASPEPEPEPRRSFVTIPALGLRDFPVVRYQGSPDDGPGTAIQDAGEMASPRGPRGGVGPGEIGNFIVTGHRLTGAAPLRYSPSLENGARILVRSGDTVHVYEVRRTRWTSFRQPSSLAAQRAPVPGRPGLEPTRAYLTLSTCATIEDHSAGNYWADQYDNPEHRIDKIAVLVESRPA